MKISKLILGLLLLFGFIDLSSDDPAFYDIEVLNTYTFVTTYDIYYFRLPVSSMDNMYARITAKNNGYNNQYDFKFDICGFNSRPTREQVVIGHSGCANYNTPQFDVGSYEVTYTYPFSTIENISYLAFCLTVLRSTRPETLYIYSENGMGVAIILLIIFLPCIIVAAVVVVVCRFCCGGCRIRINAGGSGGNYI